MGQLKIFDDKLQLGEMPILHKLLYYYRIIIILFHDDDIISAHTFEYAKDADPIEVTLRVYDQI